ncbi:hypothetical protein D9M71_581630 [compost metagenome]
MTNSAPSMPTGACQVNSLRQRRNRPPARNARLISSTPRPPTEPKAVLWTISSSMVRLLLVRMVSSTVAPTQASGCCEAKPKIWPSPSTMPRLASGLGQRVISSGKDTSTTT